MHQKIRGNTVADHLHSEHEVFLPLQGEIHVRVAGQEEMLRAGPGKMIYLPPGQTHSFISTSAAQGERLIFLIEPRVWDANEGGKFSASALAASQLCKELVFHLLIHPETRAARPLVDTLVQTLSEMLDASGRLPTGDLAHLTGKSSDERIRKALAEIQSGFATALSMDKLAGKSGMSVRNLNRLFLSELGITPKQVMTLFRIEHAKTLLRSGKLTVTDTAFEVGYQSVSQFITTFRKITGELPSEYLHTF